MNNYLTDIEIMPLKSPVIFFVFEEQKRPTSNQWDVKKNFVSRSGTADNRKRDKSEDFLISI
jgi:hypothetical protein